MYTLAAEKASFFTIWQEVYWGNFSFPVGFRHFVSEKDRKNCFFVERRIFGDCHCKR